MAIATFAQTPHADEKSITQNREKEVRERLHETLRKYANLHDAYFGIASVGNEESVPLLLERLRLDYGARERWDPSGIGVSFDCAQVHLIDALKAITNTNQGMYYPRWEAWWEANRGSSQHRWILDGFAANGLHVAEPVDEQFGLELIELIGHNSSYLNFSARRLLSEVQPELRAGWAARAAESSERFSRLGAIQVLSEFQVNGQDALLRRLAADSDLEIRREALTKLNGHLRTSLSLTPGRARILREANEDNWIRAVRFTNELLVVAFRDGEVEAFDARIFRKVWTRRTFEGAGDAVLVVGDSVILAAQEGDVIALDQYGQVLWRKGSSDDERSKVTRVISLGNDIAVVRASFVERLDAKTGATISTVPGVDFIRDADSSRTSAFFIDGRGLRSLNDGAQSEQQFPGPLAVSVTEQSVCVTSSEGKDRVTCLAPDTLSVQWARPIGNHGTWGHGVAPIQNGSEVFVATDNDLTAFGASDGATQWTTFGGQESHGSTVATDRGLLIQSTNHELELRDLRTGEVRRVWPQIPGVARVAAHQQFAAVADLQGGLWLVDLDD
jgi:hypothetical protein